MPDHPFLAVGLLGALLLSGAVASAQDEDDEKGGTISALLVTGGASHDYVAREKILVEGIRERVSRKIEWKVRRQGGNRGDVKIPLFESAQWAEGYDIVVHDHCFPRVHDPAYVDRVLEPHRGGTPAVLIHGTMMSFRLEDDRWYEFCGVETRDHGPARELEVKWLRPGHGIAQGQGSWSAAREELYFVDRVFPSASPLAECAAEAPGERHVTAWTNRYGPGETRVFGTSLGNDTGTLASPAWLDMVARGFLWSLGDLTEESFVKVEPEESLPGIPVRVESSVPPRPGPGATLVGEASALGGAVSEERGAAKAVDGDVRTWWEAKDAGPVSWEVRLPEPSPVAALVVDWKGEVPAHFGIEGLDEAGDWREIGRSREGDSGNTSFRVLEERAVVTRLRVDVPATPPGVRVGIREFAAYPSLEKVPAAFLLSWDPPEEWGGSEESPGAAGAGIDPGVRLAETIPIGRARPGAFEITANGDLFLLHHALAIDSPEEVETSIRVLPAKRSVGAPEFRRFLPRCRHGARMAWDGEWLYVLEDRSLTAYRDTDDDWIADERKRFGEVFRPLIEGENHIQIIDIQLAIDGFLYVLFRAPEETVILDPAGEKFSLSGHGILRFRRDGTGLGIELASESPISDFRIASDLRFFLRGEDGQWRPRGIPGGAGGSGGPGGNVAGSPEAMAVADSGRLLLLDPEAPLAKPQGLARVPGIGLAAGDGVRQWAAVPGDDGRWKLLGFRTTGAQREPVDLDAVPSGELFPLLGDPSPALRREAAFELLRRKRDPSSGIAALLRGGDDRARASALALVIQGDGPGAWDQVARAAAERHEPLAFRFLSTRGEGRNHAALGEIVKSDDPEVSAAIFLAIERSGSKIEGLDRLALEFAAGEHEFLAALAEHHLVSRRIHGVCLEAIRDPGREDLRATAFSLLSRMRFEPVVEEVMRLLGEDSLAPPFRRSLLGLLCDLCYAGPERERWEGTSRIEAILEEALQSRRVDPLFLLEEMAEHGIPPGSPGRLVDLAERHPSLEPYVVEELLGEREVPPRAVSWLEAIATGESRDEDLRARAELLLLRAGRRSLQEGLDRLTGPPGNEALIETRDRFEKEWLAAAAGESPEALLSVAKDEDAVRDRLVLAALLGVARDDGADSADRERAGAILEEIAGAGGTRFVRLLGVLSSGGAEEAAEFVKTGYASEDRAVREAAAGAAAELHLDPKTGKANGSVLSGMSGEEIASALSGLKGDPETGRAHFERLACASCHNIHGEGPNRGPDIVAAAMRLAPEDLAMAVLDPSRVVDSEFRKHVVELDTGVRLHGAMREGDETTLRMRDAAGNLVEIPRDRVREEWKEDSSMMHSANGGEVTLADLASLRAYLRQLGGDSAGKSAEGSEQ